MPQSPHRLRNDLKCVEWDVKPCLIQSKSLIVTLTFDLLNSKSNLRSQLQVSCKFAEISTSG